MDVSVIICTYNRAHNLPACVHKLWEQENAGDIHWEIVIVDNNSTDDTSQVVHDLQRQSPIPIRYLFESNQGLSFARNLGINETTSHYLVFIDDDIHVVSGWLRALYDTFQRYDCSAVGGRIHVESPSLLPDWILPSMYGFLGERDFGEGEFEMNGRDQFPFGGNMAFQRDVITKIGLFHTGMGRKGDGKKADELFKGEETDYFHRLAAAGGSMYYQPQALVQHLILPYQLEKKFFRVIHYNAGYLQSLHDDTKHPRTFLNVPLFLYHQLLSAIFKYLRQAITLGPSAAFRQQMNIAYFWGMIRARAKKVK